jgi:translation initiation factor 2B subunit (eIF-2B alpha/beta/delta family)
MAEKSLRRLPLRQVLAGSERTTRELAEMLESQMLPRVADFRDLTRPVRRKSQYPAMVSLQNGVRRLTEANDHLTALVAQLHEHLDAIRDHAQREKVNRKRS